MTRIDPHPTLTSALSLQEELAARASEMETVRRLPADLAEKLAEGGLFRMVTPSAYGGLECSPRQIVDAVEAVAEANASAGWCVMIGATTAMNAAFKVLALVDPGRGGRRIAVLCDLYELGKGSDKMHADLALPLKAANIDLVYTCGKHMKNLHDQLPANQRGAHKETSKELAEIVPDVLIPGDVVMVKGSLGSKMGLVVEALRALPIKFKKASKGA